MQKLGLTGMYCVDGNEPLAAIVTADNGPLVNLTIFKSENAGLLHESNVIFGIDPGAPCFVPTHEFAQDDMSGNVVMSGEESVYNAGNSEIDVDVPVDGE